MTPSPTSNRRYDSPRRRQQAAATRERILAAGVDVIHGYPIWNWAALTVRAVAGRAGVNERTVYRHFANERELRDAVMGRLREEAQVDLDGLDLETLPAVAARILEYVATFPVAARISTDPSVAAENRRQREALLGAVRDVTDDPASGRSQMVAGLLDVLWAPVSYERLVLDWGLEPSEAIRTVVWAMGLVRAALADGSRP